MNIATSIYKFCPQLWHRFLQSSRSTHSAHAIVASRSGHLIGSSRESLINRADALCRITTAVRCFSGRSGRKATSRTSRSEETVSDLDKGTVDTSSGGSNSRGSSSNWSFERIDLGSLGINEYDNAKNQKLESTTSKIIVDEIENTQRKYHIDKLEYQKFITDVKSVLNVSHMNIYLWFCSEAKIKEINRFEMKEKYATDILSLCNHRFDSPEIFKQKKSLSADTLLGDIVICPHYVSKIMQKEIKGNSILGSKYNIPASDCGATIDDSKALKKIKSSITKAGISNKNAMLFDKDMSGISLCLSFETNLDQRLKLLLVHGFLHLLGHDHQKQRSWERMTARELEVVRDLQKLGYKFNYSEVEINSISNSTNGSSI